MANTPLFNFNAPQVPQSTFGNFGFSNPTVNTPSFNTGVNMDLLQGNPSGIGNTALNFGYSTFPNQNQITSNLATQANQGFTTGSPNLAGSSSMFGDFTGADALNFGTGLISAGIGGYFQDRQLDLAEDTLQLSRDKYNDYLAERENFRKISEERANQASKI